MKIILTLIIIGLFQLSNAQIAFGKQSADGSGIVDFVADSNMGIVLPYLNDLETVTHETGTLAFDATQNKVVYFDGTDWQDLSIREGVSDSIYEQNATETGEGIVIGEFSEANGVLVLNSSTKGLILPKMSQPWIAIKNPEPGTIAYDTENNLLCVFNGVDWTFWGL